MKDIGGAAAIVAVIVSVPLTVFGLFWLNEQLQPPQEDSCRLPRPRPVLAASAGDGKVTLTWRLAAIQGSTVKAWQYRQIVQGESEPVMGNVEPAARSHVLPGLTNGIAYTFQIRVQFDKGSSCWSAAVSGVPQQTDDVMKEMEKHQEAIAENMACVVKKMGAVQDLLENLSEEKVKELKASVDALRQEMTNGFAGIRNGTVQADPLGKDVATITAAIAKQTEDTRKKMGELKASVDAVGREVTNGFAGIRNGTVQVDPSERDLETITTAIAKQAEDTRKKVGDLKGSVDDVGHKVKEGLDGIAEQIGQICDGCEVLPSSCRPVGTAFFKHDRSSIEGMQWQKNERLDAILERETGWFLNVGHATSVGHAAHNLRLSDQRAACASRCIHEYLGDKQEKFAFMEIAKGEVLDVDDPEGVSDESRENRRVDVIFCPDDSSRGQTAGNRAPVWPDAEACDCDNLNSGVPI